MRIRFSSVLLVLAALVSASTANSSKAATREGRRALQIYFIDVEGGQSMRTGSWPPRVTQG
jgi:hypothetical protein